MQLFEIVPAVLEETPKELEDKVRSLPAEISYFHLDVLNEEVWSNGIYRPFEAHLMIEEPGSEIEKWIGRGAKRIIVHKLDQGVLEHRDHVEVGLAFELSDPIEDVLVLAEHSDFVHIMAISEIGAQGHPLDERVFDRIKRVQEKFPDKVISVDGGITAENYQKLLDVGADRLVVGSHFKEVWESLKKN